MSRVFALMFVSMVLVSCNKDALTNCDSQSTGTTKQAETDTGCTIQDSPPLTDDSEDPTDPEIPTSAYTFETNIHFINTSPVQQEKFDKAIEMIKKVVATEEFKNKVLNHTYNGSKTFVDNGGFSNQEIYQKILEAAETLQPSKNNTMDMEVELYTEDTSTVGYTYPSIKKIFVNTKFFDTNTVGGVAANLFHEWLHKIGFVHAVPYSTSRNYSVPYAVGKMISTIGSSL